VAVGLVAGIVWLSSGASSRPAARPGRAVTTTTRATGSGAPVTLAFGGDVHFEGQEAARLADDPTTALAPLATLFAHSDLAMVNIESAVTMGNGCPQAQSKQYVFHAPPSAYVALKSAGVTVATQANNHGEDCGPRGLDESMAAARAAAFPVLGIGGNADQAFAPFRTTIRGQRVAIIAATDVLDTNLVEAWTATTSQAGVASSLDPTRLVAAVQ